MSIGIQDLSDEFVHRITNVLARRPEYGIAIPSRRWLQRQNEKIKNLPKELLRPSGLRRLAIKIADRIDPNIVDPQAVLCKTHSALNPFLIRRLFIALAYEVTVYTDPLRSWEGSALDPELSALVGRLDSIVALWTVPKLFHDIYGQAPFEGHHVFVRSGCEACCLAAVGASGRALADLRATLVDRMERRRGKHVEKVPRLYRVVEAWIDQLRKNSNSVDRPEKCRALSEALLVDLRMARPQIKAWRAEQKQHHHELRAARHSVYTELRRTRSGAHIAPLSPNAGHLRRTRNGIPVALVDVNEAENRRKSAMSRTRSKSIYRPDSISGHSHVQKTQRDSHGPTSPSVGPRPGAPEPVRLSGPSDDSPTQSFLHRFEQELSVDDDRDSYESPQDETEFDENDYMEANRSKVQDWFANQVSFSHLDLGHDSAKSVVSMVHPAFRPDASHVAASALPAPLNVKKDRGNRAGEGPSGGPRYAAPSVWTDCTAYTIDPSSVEPDIANAPPVPRIPSEYRRSRRPSRSGERTPRATSRAPTYRSETSTVRQRQQSTETFPAYEDPFLIPENDPTASPSSNAEDEDKDKAPPNWPAPPLKNYPPRVLENKRYQKLFLPASDVGSTLSEQRHTFLMERFKPKDEGDNSAYTGAQTQTSEPRPSKGLNVSRTGTSNSLYSRSSAASTSSASPTVDFSRAGESTLVSRSTRRDGDKTPTPRDVSGSAPQSDDRESRTSSDTRRHRRSGSSSSKKRYSLRHHPDPSSANVSSITQLGGFRGKM
ncbi:hypothetical protein F5Y03DRAFT_409170 [Xylaria venustula]|nr:hypothetical protein F5Y03DRAFT_409170 [Xylaria venustula]